MKYHYTKQELKKALLDLGVNSGDTLFCHSNIGFLGVPKGAASKNDIMQLIVETIMEVLGPEGTFVVPTFTYSFGSNEYFDLHSTRSNCGALSEYIRELEESQRSNDPSVSIAAIGKYKNALTQHLPENAYSEESAFAKLIKLESKVLNINFDAGSTLLHYIEKQFDVPYRYEKTFHGKKRVAGEYVSSKSILYVRDLDIKGSEACFDIFNEYTTQHNLYKRAPVGRGSVGLITTSDMHSAFAFLYEKNKFFLTKKGK